MLSKDLDLAHQDPSSENYCKNNVFLITDMVCMLANKESYFAPCYSNILLLQAILFILKFAKTKLEIKTVSS